MRKLDTKWTYQTTNKNKQMLPFTLNGFSLKYKGNQKLEHFNITVTPLPFRMGGIKEVRVTPEKSFSASRRTSLPSSLTNDGRSR